MTDDRFKMRIWDAKNRKMYYFDVPELVRGFGQGVPNSIGMAYEEHEIGEDEPPTDDEVIRLACTGFEDRNGKLIYEGDIVYCDPNGNWIKGSIIWFNGEWTILHNRLRLGDLEQHTFSNLYFTIHRWLEKPGESGKFIEVIGNIYENSEALNVP